VGASPDDPTTVLIATPLERDLVERLREAVEGVEILFDPDVLPTPRYPSDHRGDPSFRRDGAGEAQFEQWVARAEVTFGVPGETPEALHSLVARAPRLRWVQGTAAGMGQQVEAAGLDAADLDRVTFTSSVGVHAGQLAEFAVLGLLAFTKDLPRLVADRAAHRWGHYAVRELRGQRLLVVGLGHIGREVSRLAEGLGMEVTGVRRRPEPGERAVEDLPDLVPGCDAVVLALPGTDATRDLFGRELVDALPSHAVVVNVGRGTTIDEAGLVAALEEGRLAGAALDVTASEPPPDDSPLWRLDNVLLSPHTAALSTRENQRIIELFERNLRSWRQGAPLTNVVDVEHFY
jgi:phosphoglycerate dehydrogenase-like enzyme